MTVKQGIINNAIWVIKRLMGCNLPIAKAKAVYMLHKELYEHYKFAVEEEKKIVESLGGTIMSDGGIQFKENSEECSNKFIEKRNKLCKLDVNIEVEPIHISIVDVEGCKLRPTDIEAVEQFIIFE